MLLKHYGSRSQEQGWASETFYAEGERDTFAMLQDFHFKNSAASMWLFSGFGGLVVSMLASGTQVHEFIPGRSCRIFRAKKSSACLPSEGK
jgi:hypothetical protein